MENETTADVNDSLVVLSAAELGCPSYSDEAEQQVELFSFWVEGVSQVSTPNSYLLRLWNTQVDFVRGIGAC